jgi:hypothetical protein
MLGLSRTLDGQNELTERAHRARDADGILSLSEEGHNMLMWSYYGEGHRGIVLRLDMAPRHLIKIPATVVPVEVKYRADFPHIDYYDSTPEEFALGILGTKGLAWAHEKEWRLVLINRKGYVHVPPRMINAVIFGLRTDRDHEAAVRSWVKERGYPTDVLRIQNRRGSFELEIVPA